MDKLFQIDTLGQFNVIGQFNIARQFNVIGQFNTARQFNVIGQFNIARQFREFIDMSFTGLPLIIIAIIISLSVFFIRKYITVLVDRRISAYHNDLILKHYEEVRHIYDSMRGWRHDYHNHIQTMKVFLTLDHKEEHLEYLSKLDSDLNSVDTVLKTGNVMVDAILNSKISLAMSRDISVNAKAVVPKELKISEIDLCIIIGNLLDNAMEACVLIEETKSRFIRVYIGRHKAMLYISVSNSTGGKIRKVGGSFLTTKGLSAKGLAYGRLGTRASAPGGSVFGESKTRGFGLVRIDHITDKYGGFVNRQYEDGIFACEVTLPL